jgi:tripartite-type tricarboxylate transporter receptor subunit TctC
MKRLCAMLLLTLLVGPAMRLTSAAAQTQPWPTRPVRIVNTFAPGGAADLLARTVADGLASAFGQPFIVETRAGASGAIGVQSVAATPPDGYTFVITNVSILVLAPISNPRLGYAPLRDLTNIAYIAGSPIVLSVNPASGIRTLEQFIASAKKGGKPLPIRHRASAAWGSCSPNPLPSKPASRSTKCPTRAPRRAFWIWWAATSRSRPRP